MSENLPTPTGPGTPARQEDLETPFFDSPFTLRDMEEEGGFSLKGLLPALKRYWWILGLAGILGIGAAFVVFQMVPLGYQAEGNIWITVEDRQTELSGPITQGGLLDPSAWVELVTSYEVLDPVVLQERLYLKYRPADSLVFQGFALDTLFRPGGYQLHVSPDGRSYTLLTAEDATLEEGMLGEAVGSEWGLIWSPPRMSLLPGQEVAFSVMTPRDAARGLATRLRQGARLDGQGNFLRLELKGSNPEKLARVLNAVMERHMDVAAELKRDKLDQLTTILGEQRATVEVSLRQAEEALEI